MILGLEPGRAGEFRWFLREPDDFARLALEAAAGISAEEVDRALADGRAGGRAADDGAAGDVFVDPQFIRALASDPPSPDWERGFESMLDFARSKGWWQAGTGRVRIHVEMSRLRDASHLE